MANTDRYRSERGAVLIFVAVIVVVLMAFMAYAIDNGVMLTSRNQAQNSADAAALAAAISLSWEAPPYTGTAQARAVAAALDAASKNRVFGSAPDVQASDVTFPPCPPGAPAAGLATCVKVDVFRTNYEGRTGTTNPLPTFFARLVGINEQGTRATATAELRAGTGTADCVKPFAIADKWTENQTPLWDPTDTFSRYNGSGGLVANPDVYTPASGTDPGSGFKLPQDYGLELVLKTGDPHNNITSSWFNPVVIDGVGGSNYRAAIGSCADTSVVPGSVLEVEPGNMIGPTRQGIQDLVDLDPLAQWDPAANNGRGAVMGGCMSTGACSRSPRIVAIPVFNVDTFQFDDASGRNQQVTVTQVLGFFIAGMVGNDVHGYLMNYPTTSIQGAPINGTAPFITQVILVR